MHKHQVTEEIPPYLSTYIAKQDASLYTPIDHASWRFILKISQSFFAVHAHQKYLAGLEQTGISTQRIPLIEEMDQKLRKFNWRAVPVTGFIPPAVFMEFLSLGVLPIACDMRNLEHLNYTPAPDIVHEAAGHAPIIADREYAHYLRSYGEISRKAIYSIRDMDVYQAIRHLSDTKEKPGATQEEIDEAQAALERAIAAQTDVSEATLLSRMGWWTFEYGLVGSLAQPKIYGAGLLSSMGESYHCFDEDVEKVPFSIDCVEMTYDITRPQPQLFVAPDFQTLEKGLEELASRMAFRTGGVEGLKKAKDCEALTTTQLDTGVQVSGVLTNFMQTPEGRVYYLQYTGPTQLAYQDRELEGQGADYHSQGFGTPVEPISESQLKAAGLAIGNKGKLTFESGVTVEGKLTQVMKQGGKIILLSFADCTVKKGDEFLFKPEWGQYDMICGSKVSSVFGGAADRKEYLEKTGGFHQDPGQQKTNLTEGNKELNSLYREVRNLRENQESAKAWTQDNLAQLDRIHERLEKSYPQDWLLRYELLEIEKASGQTFSWSQKIRQRLDEIAKKSVSNKEMIQRGLEIL